MVLWTFSAKVQSHTSGQCLASLVASYLSKFGTAGRRLLGYCWEQKLKTTGLFKQLALCMQLSNPWAATYNMPPEAALPFGNGSYTWMMLEMHYNNPAYLKGTRDRGSGIIMEYTDQLRPHDMGLITLSQLQLQIPPGMAEYTAATTYCLGSCTKL